MSKLIFYMSLRCLEKFLKQKDEEISEKNPLKKKKKASYLLWKIEKMATIIHSSQYLRLLQCILQFFPSRGRVYFSIP